VYLPSDLESREISRWISQSLSSLVGFSESLGDKSGAPFFGGVGFDVEEYDLNLSFEILTEIKIETKRIQPEGRNELQRVET
jgi:hypothetical protein